MTETLVAPENETFPNRKRWTVADCERLVKKGELTGRYELIDGEIISKMGQHSPHTISLTLMGQWLVSLFGYLFVRTQSPIVIRGRLGKINEPEPDIAVVHKPTTAYSPQQPDASEVRLAVEVADSSLRFDLRTKALLYARVGIPEYLVLDVNGRRIHRHRVPVAGLYTEVVILGENDDLTLLDRSETIRVGDLFLPVPEA